MDKRLQSIEEQTTGSDDTATIVENDKIDENFLNESQEFRVYNQNLRCVNSLYNFKTVNNANMNMAVASAVNTAISSAITSAVNTAVSSAILARIASSDNNSSSNNNSSSDNNSPSDNNSSSANNLSSANSVSSDNSVFNQTQTTALNWKTANDRILEIYNNSGTSISVFACKLMSEMFFDLNELSHPKTNVMGRSARGVSGQAPNALDKARVSEIKRLVLGYVDGSV